MYLETFTFNPVDYNWITSRGLFNYSALPTFRIGIVIKAPNVVNRTLVDYDLSSLLGWRPISAVMTWTCSRGATEVGYVDLHFVTDEEFDNSTATWLRVYDTVAGFKLWDTPGGDYATNPYPSTTPMPPNIGDVTVFEGNHLLWLCETALYGYGGRLMIDAMLHDEMIPVPNYAEWHSDHAADPAVRPTLSIVATPEGRPYLRRPQDRGCWRRRWSRKVGRVAD